MAYARVLPIRSTPCARRAHAARTPCARRGHACGTWASPGRTTPPHACARCPRGRARNRPYRCREHAQHVGPGPQRWSGRPGHMSRAVPAACARTRHLTPIRLTARPLGTPEQPSPAAAWFLCARLAAFSCPPGRQAGSAESPVRLHSMRAEHGVATSGSAPPRPVDTQPSTRSTNLPGLARALAMASGGSDGLGPWRRLPHGAAARRLPRLVLADGTGTIPLRDNDAVIGRRAGCDCGWRGRQFYPRAEWPSDSGAVPVAVEGREDITATCGEWVRHVQAVPELSIYELRRHLTDTAAKLTEAVTHARRAGLSWAQIGDAAGISADHTARRGGRGRVRGDHQPTIGRADHPLRPDTGPTR